MMFSWYGVSRDSDINVKQCSTYNKYEEGNRKPRGALGLNHSGCHGMSTLGYPGSDRSKKLVRLSIYSGFG